MSGEESEVLTFILASLIIICLVAGFVLTSKFNREALARSSSGQSISNTVVWVILFAFSYALPYFKTPRSIVAEGLNGVTMIICALMVIHSLWVTIDIVWRIPRPRGR